MLRILKFRFFRIVGGKLSAEIASLTVKRQLAWFAATPSFNLLCARGAGRRCSSGHLNYFSQLFTFSLNQNLF